MSGRYRLHAIFSSLQGRAATWGVRDIRPFLVLQPRVQLVRHAQGREDAAHRVRDPARAREAGEPERDRDGRGADDPAGARRPAPRTAGAGYWLALETNGVVAPPRPDLFDYIAVSPKPQYLSRYLDETMLHRADEVRIVATTEEIAAFCRTMRARIQADAYYISPLESEGRIHYRRALTLLVKVNRLDPHLLPPWSLSIQMHKVIGIR